MKEFGLKIFTPELIGEVRKGINIFFMSCQPPAPVQVRALAIQYIGKNLRFHLSVTNLDSYRLLEVRLRKFLRDNMNYKKNQFELVLSIEAANLIVTEKLDAERINKRLNQLSATADMPDELNSTDLNLLNKFVSRAAEKSEPDDGLKKHMTGIIKRIFWSDKTQTSFAYFLEGSEMVNGFEKFELIYVHLSGYEHLHYFEEVLAEIETTDQNLSQERDLKKVYSQVLGVLQEIIQSYSELINCIRLYADAIDNFQKRARFYFEFSNFMLEKPMQLRWLVEDNFRLELTLHNEKIKTFVNSKKKLTQIKDKANALLIQAIERQALFGEKLKRLNEIYESLVSLGKDSSSVRFFPYCIDDKLRSFHDRDKLPRDESNSTDADADNFVKTPLSVSTFNQFFSTPSDPVILKEPEPEPEPEPESFLKLEEIKTKEEPKSQPNICLKNNKKDCSKIKEKEKEKEKEKSAGDDAGSLALAYLLKKEQVSKEIRFYQEKPVYFKDGRACYPLSELIFVMVLPEVLDLEKSSHQLLENNVGRGLLTTVGFGRSGVKSFRDFAIIKTRDETRILCARVELLDKKSVMRTVFIPVKSIGSHEIYTKKLREDTLANEANTSLNSTLSELHLIEPVLKTARMCRS